MKLIPVPLALTVRQGETLAFDFIPLQDDRTIFALTGASAHAAAAAAPGGTLVLDGTDTGAQVAFDVPTGKVSVEFGPSVTSGVAAGTYQVEVFVLLAAGDRHCMAAGTVKVLAAVTPNP